jgi:hypothetical protein
MTTSWAADVDAHCAPRVRARTGTDAAIRWSTAGAVIGVGVVAAVVSYEHAYDLVRAHGEPGWTAHIIPLTVDGLIWSSSMVMLDSARRGVRVPSLARWLLGISILATLAANVAHGQGQGPIGAAVAAWPAVALVGSYELLMTLIRRVQAPSGDRALLTQRSTAGTPESLQLRAAEVFADDMRDGSTPSIRTIRTRLHVGQQRAQLVQAYLSELVGG